MMKRVMLVFGTRPEAIKMAPLVKEFQKHPDKFETVVCVTGQHRQMLDQVLEIFNIKPDYDLDIMKERQTLVGITSRVLEGLDEVIKISHSARSKNLFAVGAVNAAVFLKDKPAKLYSMKDLVDNK